MKIRKHRNNKLFKITWSQRTPVVIETHLKPNHRGEKVVNGGERLPRQTISAFGSDSKSVLDAFLFGRDRTNIVAKITEVTAEFIVCNVLSKSAPISRRPRSMSIMAAMLAMSGAFMHGRHI